MKRQVLFYKSASGSSPVEAFLDGLPAKDAQKVTWVLTLIEEYEVVPKQYFKKLENTPGLYECRVTYAGNAYRLLGFFYKKTFVVLTNGFMKKTQKTPKSEIDLCRQRMKDFIERGTP